MLREKHIRNQKQMNKSSANKQRILRKEERKHAKHPLKEIDNTLTEQQVISAK